MHRAGSLPSGSNASYPCHSFVLVLWLGQSVKTVLGLRAAETVLLLDTLARETSSAGSPLAPGRHDRTSQCDEHPKLALRGVLAAPRAHVVARVRPRPHFWSGRAPPPVPTAGRSTSASATRVGTRAPAGLLARPVPSSSFLPSFRPIRSGRPRGAAVLVPMRARTRRRPAGERDAPWMEIREEGSLPSTLDEEEAYLAWELSPRRASPPDIQPSHLGHQPASSATSPSARTSEQMAPNNSGNDAAGAAKRQPTLSPNKRAGLLSPTGLLPGEKAPASLVIRFSFLFSPLIDGAHVAVAAAYITPS